MLFSWFGNENKYSQQLASLSIFYHCYHYQQWR